MVEDVIENDKTKLIQITYINRFREHFHSLRKLSLTRVIFDASVFEATDPKDKIYGLLFAGFQFAESGDGNIRPNYAASIQRTLIDATKHIFIKERCFSICRFNKTISMKHVSGLPSWVPDIVTTCPISQHSIYRRALQEPYRTAGDSKPLTKWPYGSHPDLLLTSASAIGRIAFISSRSFSNGSRHNGRTLCEWAQLATKCNPVYRTGESISDVFWRSCIADGTMQSRQIPAPWTYCKVIKDRISAMVLEYFKLRFGNEPDKIMPGQREELDELLHPVIRILIPEPKARGSTNDVFSNDSAMADTSADKIISSFVTRPQQTSQDALSEAEIRIIRGELALTCEGRKFFVTENEMVGLAPANAEVGDDVYILAGGEVPFVMRTLAQESLAQGELPELLEKDVPVCRILGEAYVHGIMRGEMLKEPGFAWKNIVIL